MSGLLLAGDGSSYSVTRAEDDRLKASIVGAGAAPIEYVARHVERDKTTLLCRALDGGADQVHEQALQMALMLFNHESKEICR